MGNLCTDGPRDVLTPDMRPAPRGQSHAIPRARDGYDGFALGGGGGGGGIDNWDKGFPPMTRAQLQAKRREFWDTRCTNRPEMWQAIRMALEAPNESGIILQSAGLTPLDLDKSDTCFTYDERGARYDIPLFVTHEPRNLLPDVAEPTVPTGAIASPTQISPRPLSPEEKLMAETTLTFKIRLSSGEDVVVETRGNDTVLDLKRKVSAQKGIAVERQRSLYQGKLLPNDMLLGRSPVKPGNVVQMMVTG